MQVERHEFQSVDGHVVIAHPQGRYLIDTGSPLSFGRNSEISILGRTFIVPASLPGMGITAEYLSDQTGAELDGLLGGDILSAAPFLIDWPNRMFLVGSVNHESPSMVAEIRLVIGVPTVSMQIGETVCRACWDSGAKISYVEKSAVRSASHIDEIEDFYPGFGVFRTRIYRIPVRIGGFFVELETGVLPDSLTALLAVTGTQAIVGNSGFERYSILFNYGVNTTSAEFEV